MQFLSFKRSKNHSKVSLNLIGYDCKNQSYTTKQTINFVVNIYDTSKNYWFKNKAFNTLKYSFKTPFCAYNTVLLF